MNTAIIDAYGVGTATSALNFGGGNPSTPNSALTQSWNGTVWDNQNDMNTGRRLLTGSGTSNTAALAFGGYPADEAVTATEEWDGTGLVTTTVTTTSD